jgi:hypothetical protein
MCDIPALGAIKNNTGEYVYPGIANKKDKYICPDCKKDLIFKMGTVRAHHFAHCKDDNPCNYYSRPSESQIHKDAKMLMKNILDNKKRITFFRKCNCYNKPQEYEIPEPDENSEIIIEHRFNYNGLKIADVAYIDNGDIVGIFEIYNTHRTEEINRPEPWFEIDATKFINSVNTNNDSITIECIRKSDCDNCKLLKCHRCNDLNPKWVMDLNKNNSKWCKMCDVEYYDKIHLNVSFSDKEKIKQYHGRFDPLYKKWYIDQNNPQKNEILLKWKVWKA